MYRKSTEINATICYLRFNYLCDILLNVLNIVFIGIAIILVIIC
ncbi:putative membrane protein [Escherichia coli 3-020-07_S3_C1]|nr:putative membrane protein [Escherichia coli 2-460-02_S4_C2]KDY73996.1 putative membrane protein [Escherichia coli 2-460-02_S4_C3]KDZ36327.1 putative membrane protein [Escherichia coli 3-020-07_S3_C1]KEJ54084.1 putative membrane protein [Escherichia coli 2-460-02_S4_C1]KEJ71271.1 putative membrane protein [Escherichia coli 3-020-07_S3_C2]